MHTTYPSTDGLPADWTLAQLKAKVRRVLMSKLGGDEASEHLLRISYAIFLLCAFFGRPAARVRVASIFRINIQGIARQLGKPTSPALVAEATEALHLLREHAVALGFHDESKPAIHPIVCPFRETDDDRLRWVPTPNFFDHQSGQTTI